MSSRILVFTLMTSLGSGSLAFAGEGLLQSGSRIVQEPGRSQGQMATSNTRPIFSNDALVNRIDPARSGMLLGQDQPVLEKSGMRKRTKLLIYVAAGVGFAVTAYTIDHHVLNVTPSTLGTRKD